MAFLSKFLATGFYTGYSPIAPGTAGSALALIIYWLSPKPTLPVFLGIILILFFVGVWSATKVEEEYGRDASVINIDEMVGMGITLVAIEKTGWVILLGFVFFRFFDIIKLFPINNLQKLPKGWGVMLDDVVAGIYANILLRIVWILRG